MWRLARQIAGQEGANLDVTELGALLHNIADWKFHGGDDSVGPEKLFLLKDRMNTPSGRALAEERHRFMESFVAQFLDEWNAGA